MFSGEIISKVKRHKKTYLFIYFFHKKQNELLCLRAAQHAVHDFLQFSLNIMIGCCVMSPCGKTSPSFFCFIAFYLNGICVVNVGPRLDSDDKHVFICFFFLFPFCFCILNVRIFSFLDILNVYLVNFDAKSTETTGGGGNSTSGCFWVVGLGLDCTGDLCFLECVAMFPRRLLLMFAAFLTPVGCSSPFSRVVSEPPASVTTKKPCTVSTGCLAANGCGDSFSFCCV